MFQDLLFWGGVVGLITVIYNAICKYYDNKKYFKDLKKYHEEHIIITQESKSDP